MSDNKNMSLGAKLGIASLVLFVCLTGVLIYYIIYFNSQKYKNTVLKNYSELYQIPETAKQFFGVNPANNQPYMEFVNKNVKGEGLQFNLKNIGTAANLYDWEVRLGDSGIVDKLGKLVKNNNLTFDGNNVLTGMTASTFNGNVEGNVKGNVTGDVTGDVTGNSSTTTKLKTPVSIGGVNFDGSVAINLPGVNEPGNQNTSGTSNNSNLLGGKKEADLVTQTKGLKYWDYLPDNKGHGSAMLELTTGDKSICFGTWAGGNPGYANDGKFAVGKCPAT